MNLSPEQLNELREHFRNEFDKHDFCIGQEQVERVFRELLGEPEPVREYPVGDYKTPGIKLEMLNQVMGDMFLESTSKLFDQDSALFKKLKR